MSKYIFSSVRTIVLLTSEKICTWPKHHFSNVVECDCASDCACSPNTLPTKTGGESMEIVFEFENRKYELDEILKPGKNNGLIIVDAPSGYGKTYLLDKITQEIKHHEQHSAEKEGWQISYLSMQEKKSVEVGEVRYWIAQTFTDSNLESIDRSRYCLDTEIQEMADQSLVTTICRHPKVLFMFDDVHYCSPRVKEWLVNFFCDLRNGFTDGAFLVIFTGRHMYYEQNWDGFRRLELSPFSQDTIKLLLKRVVYQNNVSDQELMRLAKNIRDISGGHPKSIKNIICRWTNHYRQNPRSMDLKANVLDLFNQCVQPELSEMLNSLPLETRQSLEGLSTFRILDLEIVKKAIEKSIISISNTASVEVFSIKTFSLLTNPRLYSKEELEAYYSDKGLIRRLIIAEQKIHDAVSYRVKNGFAAEIFEELSRSMLMAPAFTLRTILPFFLREYYYHVREKYYELDTQLVEKDTTEFLRDLFDLFKDRLTRDAWVKIIEDAQREEAGSTKLKTCFDNSWPIGSAPPRRPPQLIDSVVAIPNSNGEIVGTGFCVDWLGEINVVTCFHSLRDSVNNDIKVGDAILLQDKHGRLIKNAQVKWLPPIEQSTHQSVDWVSVSDIAILKLDDDNDYVFPGKLDEKEDIDGLANCRCFGFGKTTRRIGRMVTHIQVISQSGQGYYQIQTGKENDWPLEQGFSGAPVWDSSGNIIGIVKSITGKSTAFIIPSRDVREILFNQRGCI